MIAAAAGALSGVAGERLYAQGADPNAAPNPYKMQENWAQLPEGRKFGAAIKVQVDHSDGKSIWVFDRCGARECTDSTLAPMQKFDFAGKFQKAIGADKFAIPHGLYVDRDGNVWGGDQIARNGKGADLIKFAPDGKVLMILGKPGIPGNAPGYLSTGSAVVVAPNGDIYGLEARIVARGRLRIGDVDHVVLVDGNVARAPELLPFGNELAVRLENLDPVVGAVGDVDASRRIETA
jgi:hypothetical protein